MPRSATLAKICVGIASSVTVTLLLAISPALIAQESTAKSPIWQWQVGAGAKSSFEVASVKQNQAPFTGSTFHENVPLGSDDLFYPTGGLFSATNAPLFWYIRFAYKLTPTQFEELIDQLPKWSLTTRYDIHARAAGNPTKDEYRLMMQNLLTDRFKLATHYATKQMPVLALMLNKPGQLGPNLRLHSRDVPCPTTAVSVAASAPIDGGFPAVCDEFVEMPERENKDFVGGARNVPMSLIAETFSSEEFAMHKPVIDKTGLSGKYDFVIEFARDFGPGDTDPNGAPFSEALKDQLGLRLVPQVGAIGMFLVDHIEQPSPN